MAKRETVAFKRFMGKVLVPVACGPHRPPPPNVQWLPAPSRDAIALYSDGLLLDMLFHMLDAAGMGESPPGTIVAHLRARHARQV